ncbi:MULTISPECIES: lipocalin family protein [unclassified Acinetobacter]|uniref:lipocalin family protein n=1 Tax=unclassified Acinetobacter TaxID=196816 RepID=UPI002934FCE5|nr:MULTISPECIES: lipocalin family protein [unclassified Acinetobacter]WOE32436.1 lipocalin family protein [Acinetobacter sp. SAAs470]WOE37910.1 lipocalin family protein [Acinetobacter sp. SAAs474]
MSSRFLFSTMLAITSLSLSWHSQAQNTAVVAPQAVNQIDIERYAGKWYEIAHLPMYFQRHCVSHTTAQYQLNADKTIGVINRCRDKNGEMMTAEGVAVSQNAGNSKLKVSFLPKGLRWIPFTRGDYWILRIDPEYKVALIGGPSDKYLWILSREPQLDEKTYQSYLNTAKHYGYDVTKLVKSSH